MSLFANICCYIDCSHLLGSNAVLHYKSGKQFTVLLQSFVHTTKLTTFVQECSSTEKAWRGCRSGFKYILCAVWKSIHSISS